MAKVCRNKVCNPGGAASGGGAAPGALSPTPALVEKLKMMELSNDTLKQYMDAFLDNIERGLKKDTNPTAIVKCFPTFVQDVPSGNESGKFLALDLGGSKFRVLVIELENGECKMDSEIFDISEEVMTGSGAQLFDFLAECLFNFCQKRGLQDDNLPLGFTFSFPLVQKGLRIGLLERWTKGFNCQDIIGQDVVQLLNDAIARRGDLKLDVCAVLNDTTGTLMACAWKDRDTKIGLIVGTGSNACYMEKQANAELFDELDNGSGTVIINMEWGAFGDDGALDFLRTEFDYTIDSETINKGKQLHEKMISGMYMGELVRLVAAAYVEEGIIFGGKGSGKLSTPHTFDTRFVSEIESDPPGTYGNAKKICAELDLGHATEQDMRDLRYIAEKVSSRAAHMVAAGLVTVMHKMGYPSCTVGIDGTVYKMHPKFHDLMVDKIKELLRPGISYKLMLSEDGSGKGAALVAAVAPRSAEG